MQSGKGEDTQSIGQCLLAKTIQENRIREFLSFPAEWFYQDEVKTYKFIKEYLNTYGLLPPLDILKKKTEITKFPEGVFDYYRSEYTSRGQYNMIAEHYTQDPQKYLKKENLETTKATLRDLFLKLDSLSNQSASDVVHIQRFGQDVLDNFDELGVSGGLTGVPTSWPTLDKETCGIQPGDLWIVLARPKQGKTLTLVHMANAAYDSGRSPLFISMEMSGAQVSRRLFTLRTGVSMVCVKQGVVSTFAKQKVKAEIEAFNNRVPFYFLEGQFKKDIAELSGVFRQCSPAIAYVDGGYLIKATDKGLKSTWERVSHVAQELKTLASQTKVPIVVSYQFNREASKKGSQRGFEHIQLTDSIGQLASVGISIDNGTDDRNRKIEIIGGREGESGEFLINWDWERMNFEEISGETYA